MVVCAECSWFRPVKPASQLLAPFYETTAADVAEALQKIVDDEQKLRDSEDEFKRQNAAAGKDEWLSPPVMTAYCGYEEAQGRSFIAEVKNADRACKVFKAEKPARQACDDCANRVEPQGPDSDAGTENTYVKMMAKNIAAKVEKDTMQSLLETFRKGSAARKALEVAGVYHTQGRMLRPPEYVAHCRARSTPDSYVVCVLANPYATCNLWQSNQEPAMTSTDPGEMTPPPVTPLAPPPAPDGIAMPAAPPPVVGGPAPDTVLVAGNPPLTQGMVVDAQAMLEWALGAALPAELKQAIEAELVQLWQSGDPRAAVIVQLEGTTYAAARNQGVDMQDYQRESFQPAFVADLRNGASGQTAQLPLSPQLCQQLIAVYDAANPPLALGAPPLTREVADAYLDILSFVDALMENRDWGPLPEEMHATFAAQMAATYSGMSPLQQSWLAGIPLEWAKTRAYWNQLSIPDQDGMRAHLISVLGAAAQATPMLSTPVAPMAPVIGGTPAPTTAAASATTPTSSADAAPADTSPEALVDQILAQQQADVEKARQETPEQALQIEMQNQMNNATMLSNLANMRYEMMKSVVGNLRA